MKILEGRLLWAEFDEHDRVLSLADRPPPNAPSWVAVYVKQVAVVDGEMSLKLVAYGPALADDWFEAGPSLAMHSWKGDEGRWLSTKRRSTT